MARTTTSKTNKTSKSVLGELNKNVTTSSPSVEENVEIGADELIRCTSITFGGLSCISPLTNIVYRWYEFGDEELITYKELEQIYRSNRDFIVKPYFIIQDERVVDKFRLVDTYALVADIQRLEDTLQNDTVKANKVIDEAVSKNLKEIVVSKLRYMRVKGKLTNIDVIKQLESKLNIALRSE